MQNIKDLQKATIKTDKTGKMIYKFAKDIKGADIEDLQKALIEIDQTGDWIYYFAKNIKGANIESLEKAIVKIDKRGNQIYIFALNVKNANIHYLQKEIIKKNNAEYILDFARDVYIPSNEVFLLYNYFNKIRFFFHIIPLKKNKKEISSWHYSKKDNMNNKKNFLKRLSLKRKIPKQINSNIN